MKTEKKPEEIVTKSANGASMFPQVAETVTVTKETLDATPGKVLTFLRTVGTLAAVRYALRKRGYTLAEHARGWKLLHRVSGFVEGSVPESDADVTQALAEVDAWDAPNLGLADAALKHRHPAQHAFVFTDLRAARGAESLLVVHRFLDRLDALESGAGRESSREADRAAVATLSSRGITVAERARMRALLAKVETLSDDSRSGDEVPVTSADEMDLGLRMLRAFYEDWSAVARIVITRRDHLIRLGLASPRRAKSPVVAPEATAPTGSGGESPR